MWKDCQWPTFRNYQRKRQYGSEAEGRYENGHVDIGGEGIATIAALDQYYSRTPISQLPRSPTTHFRSSSAPECWRGLSSSSSRCLLPVGLRSLHDDRDDVRSSDRPMMYISETFRLRRHRLRAIGFFFVVCFFLGASMSPPPLILPLTPLSLIILLCFTYTEVFCDCSRGSKTNKKKHSLR